MAFHHQPLIKINHLCHKCNHSMSNTLLDTTGENTIDLISLSQTVFKCPHCDLKHFVDDITILSEEDL